MGVWRTGVTAEEERTIGELADGRLNPPAALSAIRSCRTLGPVERSPEEERALRLTRVFAELDSLIGLDEVKSELREVRALLEVQRMRRRYALRTESPSLHMVFSGSPGTGKTTVARIAGRLFREMGAIEKGHVVEVERADLVGEYVGHTAQRTREQIKKAQGGVLFVDEAYSLARGGEKDFGKEAIDALVKAMEDKRDSFVLILAGYSDEMERFLRSNPGLRSRFPFIIEFKDYTTDELVAIADLMVSEREYILTQGARSHLRSLLSKDGVGHGNARSVRNIVERAFRIQAVRLLEQRKQPNRAELMLLKPDDVLGEVL